MWGVVDDSAEEPWHELWGLFRPDGDVSWQHKALARKPIRRRSSRKRGARPVMPNVCAQNAKCVSNA